MNEPPLRGLAEERRAAFAATRTRPGPPRGVGKLRRYAVAGAAELER